MCLHNAHMMWNIFLYIPFLRALITLFIEVYKTISLKYILERNVTIFSSILHSFFYTLLHLKWINDLKDAPSKKRALGSQQNFFKILFVNQYRKPIRPNVL